jgi:hypothetical protein
VDPISIPGVRRAASGGEVFMSERTALSSGQMQNGREGDAPAWLTLADTDEVLGHGAGSAEGPGDAFGEQGAREPEDSTPASDRARPHRGMGAPYTVPQPQVESARGRSGSLSVQAREADDLLSRACAHAEALGARARADAEELLSRAQSQAELLRVHAEAIRVEADRLRAEAAALRTEVLHNAEASGSSADSMAEHARAAAEEFRSTVQLEVDAARKEFDRMTTEARFVRRVLRAEIDAGLVDVDRMRDDVQRLCAETNKLAAELRLLFAADGLNEMGVPGEASHSSHVAPSNKPGRDTTTGASEPDGSQPGFAAEDDGREMSPGSTEAPGAGGHAVPSGCSPRGDQVQAEAPPAWLPQVEGAKGGPERHLAGKHVDDDLAELLRQIWDAASEYLGKLCEDPASHPSGWPTADGPNRSPALGPFERREGDSDELPPEGPVDTLFEKEQVSRSVGDFRGAEALIGSGGWRARQTPSAPAGSEAGEGATPPPPFSRRRRRFQRG